MRPRYFLPHSAGRYEIQPWLKRRVTFAHLNLVDDDYPSLLTNTNAMDLILCRNVLLYFAPGRILEVVQRFHRALLDDGQLVLGPVEASQINFPDLLSVPSPGVALFQKRGSVPDTELPAPTVEAPARPVEPQVARVRRPTVSVASASVSRDPQSLFAAGRYREARAAAGRNRPPSPSGNRQAASGNPPGSMPRESRGTG